MKVKPKKIFGSIFQNTFPIGIEEYFDNNEDVFSEDLKDDLWNTFIEYPTEEMYDSRTKSDEIIMEAGKIDKEYRKYAGFSNF